MIATTAPLLLREKIPTPCVMPYNRHLYPGSTSGEWYPLSVHSLSSDNSSPYPAHPLPSNDPYPFPIHPLSSNPHTSPSLYEAPTPVTLPFLCAGTPPGAPILPCITLPLLLPGSTLPSANPPNPALGKPSVDALPGILSPLSAIPRIEFWSKEGSVVPGGLPRADRSMSFIRRYWYFEERETGV